MKIKYLGHSSFKIQSTIDNNQVIVVTDPFDPKMVGLPYSKQDANIVTSSHEGHRDHDWYEGIKGIAHKDYFVINTPGEYETRRLRIYGIRSFHDDKKGIERGLNTIYVYDFKEARLAHLGDLGHNLEGDQLEALDGVEILMIPVGGIYTINPKTAMEIIEKIEPLIVIPMHYKTEKHSKTFAQLNTLESFLKEAGVETQPKTELVIKSKSDLPANMQIIPLTT